MWKKFFALALRLLAAGLILWLLALAFAALGLQFGWTNVAGDSDQQSLAYQQQYQKQQPALANGSLIIATSSTSSAELSPALACRLERLRRLNADQAKATEQIWQNYRSPELLDNMLFAAELAAGLTAGDCALAQPLNASSSIFAWRDQEHWPVIVAAVSKDQADINRAAAAVNLEPRLLVSVALVEQLRLYYTQRELFEKFFQPLKILASANKMAWGVMAIKERTAIAAEQQLQDANSPFYLGEDYRQLLSLDAGDPKGDRYRKLTDNKQHYYSFLYGAVIIKQLISQWNQAGYDISRRPEIIATLFNIGFNNSRPKPEPLVGGSGLEINGRAYSFGGLAFELYYSPELVELFPWQIAN